MGRLEDDIKRFSRIAIDTNAFIYLMERHPEYFNVVQATAMEEKAEAFITNDVRLKGIENIEIVLLKDFA